MSTHIGIEKQILYAFVAKQILAHGRAINDVADELSLSRFAVSRMVRRARELGLVEVSVHLPDPVDIELSGALARRFGLRSAIVVQTSGATDAEARFPLASLAAQFLTDNIVDDDVVGISPGRTLVQASRLIERLPSSDVVQLTGVGTAKMEDGVEAILNLARATGGTAYPLYAPIVLPGEGASLLVQHPALRQAFAKFPHLTKAVVTIGGWPGASLLALQLDEMGAAQAALAAGVVAEIGVTLLDAHGRPVGELSDRLVGIPTAQLRDVPLVIAVGGGSGKTDAVLAVLRSGLAHVVITDDASARFALAADATES